MRNKTMLVPAQPTAARANGMPFTPRQLLPPVRPCIIPISHQASPTSIGSAPMPTQSPAGLTSRACSIGPAWGVLAHVVTPHQRLRDKQHHTQQTWNVQAQATYELDTVERCDQPPVDRHAVQCCFPDSRTLRHPFVWSDQSRTKSSEQVDTVSKLPSQLQVRGEMREGGGSPGCWGRPEVQRALEQ